MSSLSKNFFYNIILTISGYIFPFLTFPYLTRVLGPEGIGAANFALSVVDYAVLFSILGLGAIGTKEIAKCNNDPQKLNSVFSGLLSLHLMFMTVVALAYFIVVFSVPQLSGEYRLYLIGFIKIFFNVFLIEWLFQGLQNFKYVTFRSILTRLLYVIAIFVFVKSREDYWIYILITVLQVCLNALINLQYSRKFVKFEFSFSHTKEYVLPVVSLGINSILLSFYSTFITMYLGFVNGSEAVGYYTTSTKLYAIILSIISAFNGVMMPYLNSLYGKGDTGAMKQAIETSMSIVVFVSVPLVMYCGIMADDIIRMIAGPGFERSILPFQVVIGQVILVGISQITEIQILLTMDKLKTILVITFVSASCSVLIMLGFAEQYAEISAAYAVMIPHILECALLLFYSRKCIRFNFPLKPAITYLLLSLVGGISCIICKHFIVSYWLSIFVSALVMVLIYLIPLYFMRDSIINMLIKMLKIKPLAK